MTAAAVVIADGFVMVLLYWMLGAHGRAKEQTACGLQGHGFGSAYTQQIDCMLLPNFIEVHHGGTWHSMVLLLLLLQDWDALYRVSGIKSFMAVPIGGAGEVLGLLTIAKQEPGAFNDEWCVAADACCIAAQLLPACCLATGLGACAGNPCCYFLWHCGCSFSTEQCMLSGLVKSLRSR
jgi:hypothetical protein